MKYNTFLSMIQPFINARGNSIIFPPQSIEATVNLSVQQIINEYKWSWLLEDETVDTFTNVWNYYTAKLTYPCKYALWLEYTEDNNTKELTPEHSTTGIDEDIYKINLDTLYVKEEKTYTFTYLRDYNFLNYVSDSSLDIPLPDKCIPALYYLVLSQLDMIDVQQLQWQPVNNFNKYQYEMKNLKENDMSYEAQLIWSNIN